MWRAVVASVLALACAPAGAATYHGSLLPLPARGRFDDLTTGSATLKGGRWIMVPQQGSNGLDPAREGFTLFLSTLDRFAVSGDRLLASKNGKRFRYHDATTTYGVRRLDLRALRGGRWAVRVEVVGADLYALIVQPQLCQPLAIIIGDDDAFQGVELAKPGRRSGSRIVARGLCTAAQWPWL